MVLVTGYLLSRSASIKTQAGSWRSIRMRSSSTTRATATRC